MTLDYTLPPLPPEVQRWHELVAAHVKKLVEEEGRIVEALAVRALATGLALQITRHPDRFEYRLVLPEEMKL